VRFLELRLEAYGPFSGLRLDLSSGAAGGLHLIYGPNEAGKSSALRAIRDLLFGIPQNSSDDHVHPAPALRIGALLERDGERLEIVRRKRRKDSLLSAAEMPLEEACLRRFLNGLDAPSFERLYGLDHVRLSEGGAEMLEGKGDVGEALFDAGASGRSVHRVRKLLLEEADALFKDRAHKPELNKLLGAYAEQKKRTKDAVRSPDKYAEQQEAVRRAAREAQELRANLGRLRLERDRLTRLRNAFSSALERDRKLQELAALGDVPALAPGTSERRQELEAARLEAERELVRLERELGERRQRLSGLPETSALTSMPKELLRALGTERVRKDLLDYPKRKHEAEVLRQGIASKLPRLGLGDLESLLVRAAEVPLAKQARIQALGREATVLELKLDAARGELEALRSKRLRLERVIAQCSAALQLPNAHAVPLDTLERHERELAELGSKQAELERREREVSARLLELEQDLHRLAETGELPSPALLARARSERDEQLQALKAALAERHGELVLASRLKALELGLLRADELADRLRSEAQRVAELAAIEQQRERSKGELALISRQCADARARQQAAEFAWSSFAATLSSAPLSPREAARFVQEQREAQRELERLCGELAELDAALEAAASRKADAEAAHASWHEVWADSIAPLGLGPDARPEEALALLEGLKEVLQQYEELSARQRRAEGILRDIELFAGGVRDATQRFAPELGALEPVEAAERLLEAHQRAVSDAAARAALEREITGKAAELAATQARRQSALSELEQLCRSSGTSNVEELRALEQRAEQAERTRRELAQVELRLNEVAQGDSVEELVAEARGSDRGAVQARLLELDDAIPLCEEELRQRERELTGLEIGLQQYDGRGAADAAQELSELGARLAELSGSWARRTLAAYVLERVVERYRERHQGPVLRRASELFRRLTLGRYERLEVGLSEARLECVSGLDGRGVEVEGLSEGTRYQLYLALRLASLEQYLKAGPPLPLVLDDVLIHWDDERAQVALSVLADLSERMQVLLFTHHARDLASAAALRDPRIYTHRLYARPLTGALTEVEGLTGLEKD
jgi:uncharacterized protein YhaN